MQNYRHSLLKAVDFIETHLHQRLSIAEIARVAAFSKYHFHRIFKAIVGESVKEYIRKRRLTEAAHKLLATRERILDLALESQFETQESFSRAFKKMFGVNPGEYRKRGKQGPKNHLIGRKKITQKALNHLRKMILKPKILHLGAFKIIGISRGFSQDLKETIPELLLEFYRRCREIKNRVGTHVYGIYEGSPDRDNIEFIYTACAQTSHLKEAPKGMVAKTIRASRYAVFTHKGKLTDIGHTVDYIWGTWLPKSGYARKEAPDFELFDERFNKKTMEGEVDIFVPIK